MIKKFVFSFIAVTLALLSLELFSAAGLWMKFIAKGESAKNALTLVIIELKDPWRPRLTYGDFDPIIQCRHLADSYYGPLKINDNGFIGNDPVNAELTTFPEKPRSFYRVILLGGSSMAGTGVNKNNQTIAAQLETLLNQRPPVPGLKFQVLNFGIPGGYTFNELLRFQSELTYFEPDLVICLDGFNDAWNATLEYGRVHLPYPIVNWSDFSYKYFEFMNGLSPDSTRTPRFMTMTWMLVSRTLGEHHISMRRPVDKMPLYSAHPLYRESKALKATYPNFENSFYANWDALASRAATNGFGLIAYLQPHAVEKLPLTPDEDANLKRFFLSYADRYGPVFTQDNYTRSVRAAFQSYGKVLNSLKVKYRPYPNVLFSDIRPIFNNDSHETFVDMIHYTAYGNRKLAERFYEDLSKLVKKTRPLEPLPN